jgi:hypothetical protein
MQSSPDQATAACRHPEDASITRQVVMSLTGAETQESNEDKGNTVGSGSAFFSFIPHHY